MADNIFGEIQNLNKRSAKIASHNKGLRHDYCMTPAVPTAIDEPVISVTSFAGEYLSRVVCLLREPEEVTIEMHRAQPEWDMFTWQYAERWEGTLPGFPTGSLVRYTVFGYTAGSDKTIFADDGEIFSYIVGEMNTPNWAKEAVVYQIFPDRFSPGEGKAWNHVRSLRDVHGGTIRGIIDKFDHIVDMGFTAIWLNPFFPDNTHHGYHATDYFSVNPRMGTMEDIRELVNHAHKNNIRMILDFVANHWGRKHSIFQHALRHKDSPYHDWFCWKKWPDEYETYFNVKELPKLNVDNPEMRAHLFESVKFWIGDVGFDGLRLDHANGPSMDFWTTLRRETLEIKEDAWIFGEVVAPPPMTLPYQGRFHGCFDFALVQALRNTFAYDEMNVTELDAFLYSHERYSPPNFGRPAFLDNHDMDRFLFAADGDTRRLKIAALVLFTLSETPFLYYGTELGMTQELSSQEKRGGWEECRRPMPWNTAQDENVITYFKELIAFRKDHPVIWKGFRRTLHINAANQTWAYIQENDTDFVVVLINMSNLTQTININDEKHGINKTFTLPPISGDVFASD